MAGVFDIELHDGDATNQDESDDDIIEHREVKCVSNKFQVVFITLIL